MRIPLLESHTPAYSPRHYWRDDRARCPSEDVAMPAAKAPRLTGLKKLEGKPVELLLRGQDTGDDPMLILRCTTEGFELHDVINMLASSELYQRGDLVKRITGRSVRTVRRLLKEGTSVRLDTPQSIIAYQYAAALELATEVFARQAKAESWLQQSATYFYGYVPLDLVGHALGFRMVEEYLNQIKYGVYQ
jgi:putative toxin-antitoxin system antitoxin component (TIGR02293 family)